ncbi:dTDP-4-dehydrorhamnose reductase [bacterium]|nr:dTDP-4-dehydrorhamnose reductase [bacterium]
MKRLCVIGAGGLLGGRILAAAKGTYELLAADLHGKPAWMPGDLEYLQVDISDRDGLIGALRGRGIDCIVNAAAMTDVDRCEEYPERARAVNTAGAEHAAIAALETGAGLIHVSTDYVFDGENGPYTEVDEPNPLSVYGRSKYEGEIAVTRVLPTATIVRTMILFGYTPSGNANFVTWLVGMLREGRQVRIVNDQYGTPTYADQLAGALLTLADAHAEGLFHAAGPELMNRYAFAMMIAGVFDLNGELIIETTSERFHQRAVRPKRSGLVCDKLADICGYRFEPLAESLTHMKQLAGE